MILIFVVLFDHLISILGDRRYFVKMNLNPLCFLVRDFKLELLILTTRAEFSFYQRSNDGHQNNHREKEDPPRPAEPLDRSMFTSHCGKQKKPGCRQ